MILSITRLQIQSFDTSHTKSVEEIAMGFIEIANEAMCKPIRVLTEARGYDTTKHVLACFGGAGGQHACAIAKALGMSKIFIQFFIQEFAIQVNNCYSFKRSSFKSRNFVFGHVFSSYVSKN